MSSPPWMLIRLALETRPHHVAADETRLRLMDVRSRAEYRAELVRIYGFEAAVESALLRVKDLDGQLVRDRLRTDRLRDDLVALGVTPEVVDWLPVARSIPISSASQALGWLYVMERHTLVAGLLRRHIQRMLGKDLCGAVSYLTVASPGNRIRELGEAIGRQANERTPASIIAAAHEAFRAQRQWLNANAARVAKAA